MSWLNSLNSIKGQLTNLAQEVLAEARDENEPLNPFEALEESRKENEELGAICTAKNNEIEDLRKQITELQNKISERALKSKLDKDAALEDSWCWEPDNVHSDSSGGKNDNDRNSETFSGGVELINIPLDTVQQSFELSTDRSFKNKERDHQKLKRLMQENDKLNAKIAKLEKENHDLNKNIDQLDEQQSAAMLNVLELKNDLQMRFNVVSKDFESFKVEGASKVKTVEKQLDTFKSKYSILESAYNKYVEENATLKSQINNIETQLKTYEQNNATLQKVLDQRSQDLIELQKQIEIDAAKVDVDEHLVLKAKFEKVTEQLERLQGNKQALEKKLSESSSGKQSTDEEFILLQGDCDSPSNSVKDFEEKILLLESKLVSNDVDIARYLERIDELESKLSQPDEINGKLEETIEVLRRDVANLESEKLDLQKFHVSENKKVLQQLEDIKNKNDILENALNIAKDNLIDYQSEQTILSNELESRIEDLKAKLESMKAENEQLSKLRLENDSLKIQLREINESMTKCIANASDNESKLKLENVGLQKKLKDLDTNSEIETNFDAIKHLLVTYTQTELPEDNNEALEKAFQSIRDKIWKIELLEKNLKQMSEEIVELTESKTTWDHEKKTLEADIGHYETECAELMKNNEILLNELENYKCNKLETIAESNEENIVVLETQLEECNKLNRTLEEEYRELNEKITELETANLELSNQLKTVQDVNFEQSGTIKDLNSQITSLESEKSNLIFELNEMETDDKKCAISSEIKEVQKINLNLESQLDRLNKDHADLVEAMQKQNAKLLDSKKELQQLEAIIKEKDILLEKNSRDLEILEAKLATVSSTEDEKQHFLSLLDAMKNDKTELQNEIEQLKGDVERLSNMEKDQIQANLDLQTSIASLNLEKSELMKTLQSKHSENLQYYMEIQRLGQLLQNAEMEKSKQLENCPNCKIQEEVNLEMKVNIEKMQDQIGFLKERADILTANLMTEQAHQKLLKQEKSEALEAKSVLQRDLDRLRQHLVDLEESHTQETLEMQKLIDETQANMIALQDEVSKSSNAYTSASIRANQHAETIQAQYSLVTQQRDELVAKISLVEDRELKNQAALVNLQCALEQFQNDKERDINSATQKIRKELQAEKDKQIKLQSDVATLNQQLTDANQGLLAATRLSDQLESCQMIICGLKDEVEKLQLENQQLDIKLKSTEASQSDKIEKSLMKSLLIGYVVSSNQNDKAQVLKVISSVLDFNPVESEKVGLNKQQSGWFGGLMPTGTGGPQSKDNLMQAFVSFLEQESQPRNNPANMPNLLNMSSGSAGLSLASNQERRVSTSSTSSLHPATGAGVIQPILLNENVLEQFAPTRNSSSILKDILNDS